MTATMERIPMGGRPYTLVFDGIAVAKARSVRAWTEPDRGACYLLRDVETLGVLGHGFWLALLDDSKGRHHVYGRMKIQDPRDADQGAQLLPGACVKIVEMAPREATAEGRAEVALERCLLCTDREGFITEQWGTVGVKTKAWEMPQEELK